MPPKEISIYIHWPFCLKKCPYCDFSSYVENSIDQDIWGKALLQSIQQYSSIIKERTIKSIFFGGGTPSLMDPAIVEKIINRCVLLNKNKNIPEITLESNPSTFEINRFKDFKLAGINRLSTGIQSFNGNNLKFLGRNHNEKEAIFALEQGNKIFNRTSFDLIMGLPKQSLNDWKKDLQIALPFIKEHISIYQLTIEQGTPFFTRKIPEVNEELGLIMYNHNIETLNKINIHRYEISNFAKIKSESIHNLQYWLGQEYIGIGPSAHGRIFTSNGWLATYEKKNPKIWINNYINKTIDANKESVLLTPKERNEEIVMTLLRTDYPVNSDLIKEINPKSISKVLGLGLINQTDQGIKSTDKGKLCLNYLIKELLA